MEYLLILLALSIILAGLEPLLRSIGDFLRPAIHFVVGVSMILGAVALLWALIDKVFFEKKRIEAGNEELRRLGMPPNEPAKDDGTWKTVSLLVILYLIYVLASAKGETISRWLWTK